MDVKLFITDLLLASYPKAIQIHGLKFLSKISGSKKEKSNFPIIQMRFNSHMHNTPATTWIYGDKVAIVVWTKDQPMSTLIRSKEVANSYKQFFEVLWNDSNE